MSVKSREGRLTFLVIDAQLEAGGTPLDKIEASFRLEGSYSSGTVVRDDITAIEQCYGHVLPFARVADHHLVGGFEALEGEILHPVTLVGGPVG
jgi:hypothetical protein